MKKPSLKDLTLREKIGQTVAVRQNLLDDLGGEVSKHLQSNPYGCIWGMGGLDRKTINLCENSDDGTSAREYRTRIQEMNKDMKIPILVAMDCNRGLRSCFSDLSDLVTLPSLGAANSEKLANEYGVCISREFQSAGAAWWWGPEVDLESRYGWCACGRTASDDPELLSKISVAAILGSQNHGVAATAKHFPGGDGIEYRDSHVTNNILNISYDKWHEKQGRIFQSMIDGGVYSIMIKHASFPAVDDTKVNGQYLPATLSYKIITGLLKNKMGFKGVVVTDAIGMGGMSTVCKPEEVYINLLKAGNDVILGPEMLDYIDVVEQAVLNGDLGESRVDDACQRVLDMKEKLGFFEDSYQGGIELTPEVIFQTKAMNRAIAEKALTLVCDTEKRLPFDSSKVKKVTIICSSHVDVVFKKLLVMKSAFERRGANVHLQRRLSSKEEIEKISTESDLIVYAAFIAPHQPMGAHSFYNEEFETFFHALTCGKEKSIGISLWSPYIYYDFFINANIFVNAYNYCVETQETFVAAIYGEIPFQGESPFQLFPDSPRI